MTIHRARRGLVAMLLALGVCVPARAQSPPDRVLVMPFENVTRDGRIFWLTEAAAALMADDLNGLGVAAITRAERQQAFDRLQVPPAAALTDATVIRIGQLVGAAQVVVGSLQLDGETIVVRARSIALESGRIQSSVTDRGPLTDLFAIFERMARGIAPPSTKTSAEVEGQHPPLAVFEDYIKGLLAETPATAINYLNAALSRQPSFDRARLALWEVYAEQGDHQHALAAAEAVTSSSPLARRAMFLAGLSRIQLKKYDEAFTTFKTLLDQRSTPTVLNNLGVVQLRRGGTTQSGGEATYYFKKAAEADPDDPDYVFNLGYASWQNRDPQATIYWLREAVRRNPADGDAHFVLAAALAAGGKPSEAARERDLARRLSAAYEPSRRPGGDAVPRGLERIKNQVELPHARIEARLASFEQRDQEEMATFHLDRGRRLFQQENDRDALVELNHALYLSPYRAEAHLLVGRIHLRNGRIADAIGALKVSLWSAETAEAHAVLGEAYRQSKDFEAARGEAERALSLDPTSAEAKQLFARLDSR
ncbi:MAG TPA: tetratricopeptide repeat protein [Vicinamibacterales bacterium]|nr:tetratricopeptide repeat protein [Vicinamibacterales bacterium]